MNANIEEQLSMRVAELEQLAERHEKHKHHLTELVERQGAEIKRLKAQLPPEDATFYELKQRPEHRSVLVLVHDPETRVASFHTCIADAAVEAAKWRSFNHAAIYVRYNPK